MIERYKETLRRAVAAMRANREVWRAAEMVRFLEREGCEVGFESYEMVVEGCVERGEYVPREGCDGDGAERVDTISRDEVEGGGRACLHWGERACLCYETKAHRAD